MRHPALPSLSAALGALLIVVLFSNLGRCLERRLERRQRQAEFDFFFFVRQWDPTYCDFAHCTIEPERAAFTIHGLWPNYNSGGYPQFCDPSQPFREGAIDDLLDDLKTYWPSFAKHGDDFWKHEWEKHGTCAESTFPTEHAYFSGVLNLHKRYNLRTALEAESITASNYQTYDSADALAAIDKMTRVEGSSILHCEQDEVSEVWICLDKNTQPMQCPDAVYQQEGERERECGEKFKMPLLKHDGPESSRSESDL